MARRAGLRVRFDAASGVDSIETDMRLCARRISERRGIYRKINAGKTDEMTHARRLRKLRELEREIARHHERIGRYFWPLIEEQMTTLRAMR